MHFCFQGVSGTKWIQAIGAEVHYLQRNYFLLSARDDPNTNLEP